MQVLETLRQHQLLEKIDKCEFAGQLLVYPGHVIGGGELNIDPKNLEAILKWLDPTNFTEFRRSFGAT